MTKLHRQIYSAEIESAVVSAYQMGFTRDEITSMIGVGRGYISACKRRWEKAYRGPDIDAWIDSACVSAAQAGLGIGEAGALLGVRFARLRRNALLADVTWVDYTPRDRFPPEIEKAASMAYEDGFAMSEIINMLGINETTISKYARLAGVPARGPGGRVYSKGPRRYTSISEEYVAEIQAAACSAFSAGYSKSEIAALLGIPWDTASRLVIDAPAPTMAREPYKQACGYLQRSLYPGHWLYTVARSSGQHGPARRIQEHRRIMAEHIGRPLMPDESVHHINGDRADNRLENLELHSGAHGPGQKYACAACRGLLRNGVVCTACGGTNWTPIALA